MPLAALAAVEMVAEQAVVPAVAVPVAEQAVVPAVAVLAAEQAVVLVAAPAAARVAARVAVLAVRVAVLAAPAAVLAVLAALMARQVDRTGAICNMGRSDHITETGGAQPMCAPGTCIEKLCFEGLPHAVELRDANDVGQALGAVMPGWALSFSQNPSRRDVPVTTIQGRDDGRYDFRSRWAHRSLNKLGLAGATCAAVADLTQAFCDALPGVLGLHCGAVRIGQHLVSLTGPYRAGKTTLVTRLATEPGVSFFCDDILPILPDGETFALGIQPRLRLPLPLHVVPEFRAFVNDHLTVNDKRYGYVSVPTLAARGMRAPLSAVVVLSRRDEGVASLHRMEVAEAAGHLIRQNIADPGAAETHYDRIAALANNLLCLKLQYSDLEDAVALLLKTFEGNVIPSPGVNIDPPLPPKSMKPDVEPADLQALFRRSEQVVPRIIGADIFLWQLEERNFYGLNPIAAAIWTLLETPATGLEITEILGKAFPDFDAAKIKNDAAELLGALLARNLVSASETT